MGCLCKIRLRLLIAVASCIVGFIHQFDLREQGSWNWCIEGRLRFCFVDELIWAGATVVGLWISKLNFVLV